MSEAPIKIVLQAAKQAGFQEDHFVSNVKILLGLGA